MGKNIGLIVILGLIVLFSVSGFFVSAIDSVDSAAGQIGDKVDSVGKIIENPADARDAIRSAYLKQEFGNVLLTKPVIGPIIAGYQKISPYTDPAIEFLVGMAPVLSWFFFLVLAIWIVLMKYFYTFYEVLRDFSSFSDMVSLIMSLCVFVILIVLNFFQNISLFLANKIVSLLEFFDLWWVKVIGVVIFIFVVIFLSKFSRQINAMAFAIKRRRREAEKEREREERDERQETATKKVETFADTIDNNLE
jgi:hypothetical protein